MTQFSTHLTGEHLVAVLELHFDPKWGTPYWLDRASRLGFDPRKEVRSIDDLPRLGATSPALLRTRPLDWFLSKKALAERDRLLVVQTGGTLAAPVWTAYRDDEFEAAFVAPFIAAAAHVGFPRGRLWLYAGPSGPHVIGRAAEAIARRTGSPAPFTVDFDPRWAKKLVAGSFAAARYLEHVVEQSLDVIDGQNVGVLFSTPPVLDQLARRMTPAQRARIEGVHYGGMALSPADLERLPREAFSNAVHLAGYGNSLFGCCLELSVESGRVPTYFPHGDRLIFGVVESATGVEPGTTSTGACDDRCTITYDSPGHQGTIAFCRLDETMLLANVVERDTGRLVAPPDKAPAGFVRAGVVSPEPVAATRSVAAAGLY